jgi:hypothetical protein
LYDYPLLLCDLHGFFGMNHPRRDIGHLFFPSRNELTLREFRGHLRGHRIDGSLLPYSPGRTYTGAFL